MEMFLCMHTLADISKEISESHKTLWILCGLPYSGKTYIAKQILQNLSAEYVSIDAIFKGQGFDWSSNHLPNEKGWEEIFTMSYQQSQEALKKGLNVLYDSTNHTKASRDILRKVATDVGADVKVLWIDTTPEIVWKRWEDNLSTKKRPVVDKTLVEATINTFEQPTEDEAVVYYRT